MCGAVATVCRICGSTMGGSPLLRLLIGSFSIKKGAVAAIMLRMFPNHIAAVNGMRGMRARRGDWCNYAHSHGVAQQAAQDQRENEQDGQAGAHGYCGVSGRKKVPSDRGSKVVNASQVYAIAAHLDIRTLSTY